MFILFYVYVQHVSQSTACTDYLPKIASLAQSDRQDSMFFAYNCKLENIHLEITFRTALSCENYNNKKIKSYVINPTM